TPVPYGVAVTGGGGAPHGRDEMTSRIDAPLVPPIVRPRRQPVPRPESRSDRGGGCKGDGGATDPPIRRRVVRRAQPTASGRRSAPVRSSASSTSRRRDEPGR